MSLTTILPQRPVRILVHIETASWRGTYSNRRGGNQCPRHRVASFRCLSVSVCTIDVNVSVSVLLDCGLGSVRASTRAVRMNGLPIVILRSDFAMLQEGKMKPH
jgi:hypothetical protein